jgi:ketosteroid isomerase-like protein
MSLLKRETNRQWLPFLLAAAVCAVLIGCATGGSEEGAAASAGEGAALGESDEMGLISAHKALIKAMEASDVAAVTALVDPSADLIVFHPFLENRFDGIGEVDEGLGRMFEQLGGLTWTESHAAIGLEGNAGWVTSHVMIKSGAFERSFVGRGTEIWVNGPGGWRLKHAHWSQNASLSGTVRGGE